MARVFRFKRYEQISRGGAKASGVGADGDGAPSLPIWKGARCTIAHITRVTGCQAAFSFIFSEKRAWSPTFTYFLRLLVFSRAWFLNLAGSRNRPFSCLL